MGRVYLCKFSVLQWQVFFFTVTVCSTFWALKLKTELNGHGLNKSNEIRLILQLLLPAGLFHSLTSKLLVIHCTTFKSGSF